MKLDQSTVCYIQSLLQDLELLSMDTVQCFMLPWDVRRLLAALRNLLCSDAVPFGTLEPSLLCTINARTPVSDGQLTFFPALGCCVICLKCR